ncbi:FYVE, RhoGEF and PH domain-containing protein 6-like [Xiphophorus maculatus]|uniref:FYVE, RhoGEF and PH domain containing 6 n=1 Tax=Xiphophorus maculatus TaxID=8083 RepID=M4AQH6_XIPMA|nr:FYVE, RhoGEF and PH domain-containing protein 6-like [Xiphophorus maculatus]XP_023208521.1 FYVE, RhoGEF and PH domain-containing protein 6-like [Xiphophorus maculatus]
MEKPPVAPKPKFIPKQRPVLSSPVPKRDGLSPLYPGPPKKVKPALPPKPCLAKLLSPSESKPLIWKRMQQEPALETHQRVTTLNSHNGISHSKKPDWDYIIPICLCSQENCACVKNKKLEQGEKDFESSHVVGKPEENQKTVPIPQGSQDNNRGKTNNTKSQVMNNSSSNDHIINHYEANRTQNHNFDSYSLSTDNGVGPSPRSSSEGIESSAIHPDVRGPGQQAGSLGTEQTSALQPKRAPPVLRKPGFPVPRKPRRYVPAHQEKVENDRDETAVQEKWEASVKEVEVSTDGKGCSSLSVSEPGNENRPPVFLSARRACPPPVPPFRKKPLLSNHLNTPSPSMQTPSKDMRVEDSSRGSSIYEIELCVDGEVDKMQKKVMDDQVESNHLLFHTLLKQPELKDLPTTILAAEDKRMENKMPRKHRRNKSSLGLIQKKEILEGEGVNKLEDFEARQASTAPDGVSKDLMRRELPLTPDEKLSKKHAAAGNNKPSRSSTAKKKAKSFSTADCSRSEGQRGNTFKKMLELKLVKKTPPKTPAKPDRTNESTANNFIPESHRDPYVQQKFPVFVGTDNNFHHSQTDVEQSVDGDELYPEPKVSPIYETIPLYDDIPQYENVNVGKARSPPGFNTEGWPRSPYDDEGIYELQDPYFSLVINSEHHQTPTEYHRNSVDEEAAFISDSLSDDDIAVNTSDEDDEDDSSVNSDKDDTEHPAPCTVQSGQKKSKIQHIATEIMTSESVFVDVLKLLHVDFREAVHKASRQNGKPVIEERHLNQILYYLPQLYELNQDLLKELEQRVANWDESSQVADIFLKKGPYLKMYSTYIREFDKNVALLVEQSKKNSAFGAVVKEFETSPRCANLAVKHYLLKPVQRIPQYQLLLTEYLKNLSVDSDDYKDTEAALSLVKEVANHANDIMKHGDNFQKLVQVQCRLNGNHEIVQPGRSFIKEGVLMKLSRKVMQPRMFFLLSDVLLYTTPVQSGQYKLKNMLSLAGMKVSKPSQEAYQNELNIESVERSFILSASSAAERDEWLKTISSAISEYTKKKISFISNNKPAEENLGESVDGPPLGSTAPIWIPDTRTTMCMICTCDFTLTWRRHHCRACGKVVCQACSSNKHGLAYLKKQSARVCDQCFDILQHKSEIASAATLSPGSKATVAFNRKHKRIPAALKEVSANTDNSSMSGYLQRTKHNKKQGKRLWFVIKDKVLYTYAASEDVAALESLPLLGFVLEVDSSQKQQFKLVHKNILHYIFRADDVQTAQRWIDTFKEAVVL